MCAVCVDEDMCTGMYNVHYTDGDYQKTTAADSGYGTANSGTGIKLYIYCMICASDKA